MPELNLDNVDLGSFGIGDDDGFEPDLENQVRANMDEALKINPDQHAQTTKLSQQSGVPEFAVESDPAQVEHGLKLDNIDFSQMSTRNPNTEKYLTDFNNSVIAQDDIEILQSIEDLFDFGKTFENIGESITTGFSSQLAGLSLAGADMTPERIQDLIPTGAMPPGVAMPGEIQQMNIELAERFGITTDEQLQAAKQESIDKMLTELRELHEKQKALTPEDLNLLEQGVRAGVESLGNMAPGFALMLLSGGRAAPLLVTMGTQTYGASYGEGRAEGLTHQEATWFASIDAAIEVGTEMLPTRTLETILTGKSTGMKKAALKFAIQEMGTEQLATLGQSLNSYLFGLDEEMEAAETTEEMVNIQLRRQAVTAIATVVAGGAQVTAATGLRKGLEALTQDESAKQTKGDVEQQKIDRLNEQSEKSKLRERDKESFKQFVNEADGENNTNVFIDGAQTSLYLQSKTREEIEADAALKLLSEQAREAANLGTDVQIPVADFAAEITGTDHYAELRDSMTMSEETIAPFRQEQQKQETETYVRNLMEEAQESTSEYVEAQEIYTQVRDQLIDTGQVTPANASIMAQIVPAWATAQARRQGKTVQQVYQDSGLVIEGPATGERARLEGEMVLEQEPAYKDAPVIFDQVRDEFLNVLPEDATVEDVNDAIAEFSPEYQNFIKALERDDWLGFDHPSQAINAALSEEIENFEVSKGLKQSLGKMVNKAFAVTPVEPAKGVFRQLVDKVFKKKPVEEEVLAQAPVEDKDLLEGNLDDSGKYTETEGDVQPTDEVRDRAIITGRETIKQVEVGFETLDTSAKVALATISLSKSPQEKFWAITLDKDNKPLAILNHTIGLKDSASVDPAAVAGWAVSVEGATQVYFSHNHPSDISVLSSADKTISKTIKNLLDGSGVESKGIMAVTPTDFTHEDGTSEFIPVAETSNKVDLVERTLERLSTKNKKAITSPATAKSIIEDLSQGDEGVLLLNNQHVPVGFLPLDFEKEGGQLRGGKLATLLKAVESTNAAAVMLNTEKLDVNERNVANMLAAADMRVLDAFVGGTSATELGMTITTGTTFKQRDGERPARGYYDPANSVIRLTEAADLSTFLHEFAHFMYEMEVNGDTEMLQSINSWYKRNAEDVAKEANGYLGAEFDTLKQGVIKPKTEAFREWFKHSKVKRPVYHATVADFDAFDTSKSDLGAHFGNEDQADFIAEKRLDEDKAKVIEVWLNLQNPLRLKDVGTFHADGIAVQLEKKGLLEKGEGKRIEKEIDADWKLRKKYNPVMRKLITDAGYDGVIYKNEHEGRGDSYIAFEPEQIKSVENLGTFDPTDPSMFKQEQDTPTGAEGSITEADVTAFLDNGTTNIPAKDSAIRRAVHEQFARGFETYLMEGKAPSIELRNAFRAFARWLSRIYQALRGTLDVKIDAEMRQVFDRLLATEEQIQAAEARARVEPMFTDAAMAGMTEEEFADYQTRQEKVKDIQSETLRDKIIKQLTRQTKKWWKEEKQDIIDEEIESLNKQQVYETRNRLRDGDMKLDHATVKDMAGKEKTDKLGRKSIVIPPELRGMTAKGMEGIHPDEAAAFFGYSSGSEMLNDLTTAPNIKVQAEVNAEARMIDRHGDILTDGTIEQEADEAVQNEERGKLILAELKTLAKGTNAPTIERNTIKDLATTNIGKLSFREIHPGKYRKAEIRAAQESTAMLATGNREGAATAKFKQVMNYYLGMAATEAKNETTKIVDRMARYNKKKVREEIMKAEGGYWDQIVKILNRFEFRKVATLKEVESLNLWMTERINEVGDGLSLTNAVLNESYVTHWKNVPFSDLQGINDSVKNIEHVARYANKLTRMGEEIAFNKLVDRWTTSMNEKVKTRFVSQRTDVAEGRKWGRWFMAQMTKIPVMASWLDGGERAGISHQVMVQPFTDAYNAEIKLWEKAGKPVMDAIENRSKKDRKRHNQKNYIPEIDDNLYGHQILAVALNTGNQSNLKKMLLGEGWADPDVETDINFNNPKLQAVLSRMTKSDWELVQKIWDQMDTLYPQLAEVHRRTTGLTPPKVEATPVETEFGTFKGGYYPVKYDPNRDQRAALNEDKLNAETESMFSNNASIQASVNTGATNERTGYYAPIRLSLDVVPAHFQETIHYITHHDPVREVNRLTRNKQVAQTIKEKLGPEEYAQLRPWLNDIAKDGREAPTKMFWDSILGKLRFGVTLGVMGFKASTGIIQISGLSNSIAEVGTANMMQSMRSILGSITTIKQAWEFAVENSQVMEHRTQTMDREIKNAMKRIEGKRGLLAAAQEASMKHIALIQTYMVDLPSWHAAYIKGMKEWGDETRSFQYADWVIENVQGSGVTKDMARIFRGQAETGRMFTMFMTFFSSLWNMERDLVKGAKTGRYSTTNVAAKMMFMFTIPVLFEMMMRGELGEPEDDEDTRLQKMLTGVAMFPIQSIPFIRDIASATTGEFGYNISPLQSIIEQGTKTIPELITRGFTDEEITKGQVKGATKFIGATLGIPGMNQAWATGEHLYDVIEEGEEFTTHELLFGPRR